VRARHGAREIAMRSRTGSFLGFVVLVVMLRAAEAQVFDPALPDFYISGGPSLFTSAGYLTLGGVSRNPDDAPYGGAYAMAVVRTVRGRPDPTFGRMGEVAIPVFGFYDVAWSVESLPDGRIVVGGNAYEPHEDVNYLVVARLMADGSADPTFNGGFAVVVRVGAGWAYAALGGTSTGPDGSTELFGFPDGKLPAPALARQQPR
jgi:hypothetical protein